MKRYVLLAALLTAIPLCSATKTFKLGSVNVEFGPFSFGVADNQLGFLKPCGMDDVTNTNCNIRLRCGQPPRFKIIDRMIGICHEVAYLGKPCDDYKYVCDDGMKCSGYKEATDAPGICVASNENLREPKPIPKLRSAS
ncbi:hypothetical protein BDF19DRAFT_422200 [Syncephalis fuscata]|nr:hypothetical protein BDF19DRAFT_422200 [Syncephalis fuscata]